MNIFSAYFLFDDIGKFIKNAGFNILEYIEIFGTRVYSLFFGLWF